MPVPVPGRIGLSRPSAVLFLHWMGQQARLSNNGLRSVLQTMASIVELWIAMKAFFAASCGQHGQTDCSSSHAMINPKLTYCTPDSAISSRPLSAARVVAARGSLLDNEPLL